MKDQVKKLSDRNIVAVQIQDKFDTCDDAVKARISTVCSLIFTSPELILGDKSWLDVFRSPVFSECLAGLVGLIASRNDIILSLSVLHVFVVAFIGY